MKVAISIWNNRIAPVFDVSNNFFVFDGKTGEHLLDLEFSESLDDESSGKKKASFLANAGVTKLICGAISCFFENELVSRNIEVFSFISGSIDEVTNAFVSGKIESQNFGMPGCGRPRRRRGRQGGRGGNRRQGRGMGYGYGFGRGFIIDKEGE